MNCVAKLRTNYHLLIVLLITDHSKSADLNSLHLNDPYPLYEAKRQIDNLIREWSVPAIPNADL